MKRKDQERSKLKQSPHEPCHMESSEDLFELHSSISFLIDSFLKDSRYRQYVPLLSQAEYILDHLLVQTQNMDLHGKTKAYRTFSQVLSRTN